MEKQNQTILMNIKNFCSELTFSLVLTCGAMAIAGFNLFEEYQAVLNEVCYLLTLN